MPESVDTAQPEKVAPTETIDNDTSDNEATPTAGEEIRPYVYRFISGDLDKPLLITSFMYLVRQGHEAEDTKLLELATQRNKLRAGVASVKEDTLMRNHSDADMIATLYNTLPLHERERVWDFAHDAEARQGNTERQRDFAILETFVSFLWEDLEATPAEVMQWVGLTQEQYDLYKAAWQMLQDVYNRKWRVNNEEAEGA